MPGEPRAIYILTHGSPSHWNIPARLSVFPCREASPRSSVPVELVRNSRCQPTSPHLGARLLGQISASQQGTEFVMPFSRSRRGVFAQRFAGSYVFAARRSASLASCTL